MVLEGLKAIPAFVIPIVLFFFIIGIGADVLETSKTNNNPSTENRVNNESQIANLTGAFNLTNTAVMGDRIIFIFNSTNGRPVGAANYTLANVSGNRVMVNFTGYVNSSIVSTVGVNYSFRSGVDTSAVNVTSGLIEGTEELGNFSNTMGVVAAVAILLLIMIGGFGAIQRFR